MLGTAQVSLGLRAGIHEGGVWKGEQRVGTELQPEKAVTNEQGGRNARRKGTHRDLVPKGFCFQTEDAPGAVFPRNW